MKGSAPVRREYEEPIRRQSVSKPSYRPHILVLAEVSDQRTDKYQIEMTVRSNTEIGLRIYRGCSELIDYKGLLLLIEVSDEKLGVRQEGLQMSCYPASSTWQVEDRGKVIPSRRHHRLNDDVYGRPTDGQIMIQPARNEHIVVLRDIAADFGGQISRVAALQGNES